MSAVHLTDDPAAVIASAPRQAPAPQATDQKAAAAPSFVVVPLHDLKLRPPEPPSYWWDGYLPAGVVTLLGAHGGTGKSTLALMLAVCTAIGLPLFGVATRRGNVAFFSGEDGSDVLRHRLAWVCRVLGVEADDLVGRLHVLDATHGDPTLFHELGTAGGRRIGATTPVYDELLHYVQQHEVGVLIVDNASDTFDASEIDRAKVRAFMRALARIAQDTKGAVLLLAHVDKGTSRGDRNGTEGYSGSTAWHNSARSRLYLSRTADGALQLEHQKANLGEQRQPLRLIWPKGGLPQVEQPLSGVVQHLADRNDTSILLRLIAEFTESGRSVGTATTGPATAAQQLRHAPTYPKRLTPGEVFELLRQAERRGLAERVGYADKHRKARERWEVTQAGRAFAGLAPVAPVAPVAPTDASSATGNRPAPVAPVPVPGGTGGPYGAESGTEVAG